MAPNEPDYEIVLFPATENVTVFDEETRNAVKLLLDKGMMDASVLLTPHSKATYEELKAKGVHFKSEPKEQFYGTEFIVTDEFGNWFSLTQPKEM